MCIGHIFGSLGNQRQKPSERSKPISHSSEDLLFTPRASARCHSLHLSFYEANPLISPAGLHCIAQTSSSPTRASARSPFAQSPIGRAAADGALHCNQRTFVDKRLFLLCSISSRGKIAIFYLFLSFFARVHVDYGGHPRVAHVVVNVIREAAAAAGRPRRRRSSFVNE